jgi:inner membrane protein
VDNVTHALAGLLIADGVLASMRARGEAISKTARSSIVLAGVLGAELPDIDLLWSGVGRGDGALRYMLHHRGHSHTIIIATAGAALLWGLLLLWRRELRSTSTSRALLIVSLLGTLSHLLLDWTNSYGVHPFWPWDARWFYGDAIFIVEPWIWVVTIPALMLGDRTTTGRTALGLLLATILSVSWLSSLVGLPVASALTAGTIAMGFAVWRMRGPSRAGTRVAMAATALLFVETTFFAAGRAARSAVRSASRTPPADVVLTPAVADPRCWSALAVWDDASGYQVRGAEVRPFPTWRRAKSCRTRSVSGLDSARIAGTASVRWTGVWTAPAGELVALARQDCWVAAALRFMRVPAWERTADGLELWDLRYGRGGFASITSRGNGACPEGVPGWIPPRATLASIRRNDSL